MRSVSPTDLAQKAFVRGLADDVDEEALRRAFSKYGTVVEVTIARHRESNAPRGFGFITFENSTDCNKACTEMDEKEFHGRSLHVELASHFNKNTRGRNAPFRGFFRGGSFRGGRGGRASSVSPPPRGGGYSSRRGGSTFRGGSFRGGSSRGDYRGFSGRTSDDMYSGIDRFRSELDRDPLSHDYGSRYDSGYEYRSRSERQERNPVDGRGDYVSYRSREYEARERDYAPMRSREYSGYYSPPRDHSLGSRDYMPVASRDYLPSRDERDYNLPSRRYGPARDYMDDYDGYDTRSPRREYNLPPRDYGSSGRYESFTSSSRGAYKSTARGVSYSSRDTGARDNYLPSRGMPSRRMASRDVDRSVMPRPRSIRSPDGPPMKRMKPADVPVRHSPRGAPSSTQRRY